MGNFPQTGVVSNLQTRKQRQPGAYRKQRRMSYNGKTLLWLFLFFPVGLTLMWRWKCSWRAGVKAAISAPVLLALLAVMLYPSPNVSNVGSITLYG